MGFVTGLLIFIHIVAFIAGGANSVVHPLLDPRLATAAPAERAGYLALLRQLSVIGRYAMIALLVSGILTLWLKWNFTPPNFWFWIKMLGVVAMLGFIGMGEAARKKAEAGDAAAMHRADLSGKLTGAAFAVVIFSAVFAFAV
jgi:putative membrane protein